MTIHESIRNSTNQRALFVPVRVISRIVRSLSAKRLTFLGLGLILELTGAIAHAAPEGVSLTVSVSKTRAQRGETVDVAIKILAGDTASAGPVHALLLQPSKER